MPDRITAADISAMKSRGEPIVCLTAYDYPMARILDEAGVDLILVGDSLGNVVLGYENTLPVSLEDMLHHAAAVCRGVRRAHVAVDMPFLSYQVSVEQAIAGAGRVIKETGAQSVKLEGGGQFAQTVRWLVEMGIPIMGHLGYTPQSVHTLSRRQAWEERAREALIEEARALETAGCYSLVLELVPMGLAGEISRLLSIPTIGIGSGPDCDGQVLVLHDMLGIGPGARFRHVKAYASLEQAMFDAVRAYCEEVRSRQFPQDTHGFQ